ncbi:Predicted Zn peptidase [Variovorax sp. HW608]|uniref:ImmA/IrrE family metallo-endopeptidase n=1 Tax=Variovorax sp. HW608 TaxID=1034889 RepID=UPI00081F7EB0|nr:ImmA/IrrE family metallo-endopeptidase [Variovorax sp. HW608]SCK42581.1 Predicted Zn peptidase [Variovorax sp. HW608]
MLDEAEIRMHARRFMAGLDLSLIAQDLSVYTKKVQAKLRKEELEPGESGYTLTKRDGSSVIIVNERERLERQRFSICHEVAHIVLELKSDHRDTPSWSYAKRDENEIACDIFAAELLMPLDAFKRDADQEPPSFQLVERLRGQYVVSFAACASRLAAVSDYPCAFVTMNARVIRHASRSKALRDLRAWIVPKSPIPQGSVAQRLVRDEEWSGEDDAVPQDVWFQDWPKGYDLIELAKHYPSYEETFSLLWFEQDSGPDEPVNNFAGVPAEQDDGGLRELDGHLSFSKRR